MTNAKTTKRRRAPRRTTGLAAAALGLAALAATATAGMAADAPDLVVTYWQQSTPSPETILATQPELQKTIPANLTYHAITSGPAALAAMKAGSYDFVGGVGNPPVLAAIANRTDMKIVWAQYYDFAGLAVRSDIAVPDGLVGKQVGEQIGSSEAFSFYGWLKNRNLLGKVKLVNLTPPAMMAAYKSGAIAGGWVSQPWPSEMAADKGKLVATSADMAKEGYPGVNVVVAKASLVKAHPEIVQAYVCAMQKTADMVAGPGSTDVLNKAGAYSGGEPNSDDVIKLGKAWPYWPIADQTGPNGMGTVADPGSGLVAKVLYQTGQWMKEQGTIANPPDEKAIAAAIDPTFAQGVVDGHCK
ncbi:ABC transporter substrate-binding protein [Labrys monachus]|uniref:ABC-type taurine transport system substrate-binding protein n=1 Tax=Labrys monachus TaxID=217067 RepID=A0ABU0FAG3_9HYPH|nr:ABC transporter substrate-binding protein [Labrys monachus]MDQ0391536.1 ABC-type taurine transport system substrate-binding protein [Labrys monachus]